MNKKEVLEIKKNLTMENAVITNICGCYVDGEKNIKFKSKCPFNLVPEEEAYKYYEIFKKTLSGSVGKNLVNIEFKPEDELQGGKQEFLLRLKDSGLEDDELLDEVYNRIINNYEYTDNYYIILIHGIYDIPGKSNDNIEMFDASDNVYDYILCSICPVKPVKSGLSYDMKSNSFIERVRDLIVDSPKDGFLYPAFNDRNMDVHSLLYYIKNPKLQSNFAKEMFGIETSSVIEQREFFNNIVKNVLNEDANFETVKSIYDTLYKMVEENKDEPEPLLLSGNIIRNIFEENGVSEKAIKDIENYLREKNGKEPIRLFAQNIINNKSTIETSDVIIKISNNKTDKIEKKVIDGEECLVIKAVGNVVINGINL